MHSNNPEKRDRKVSYTKEHARRRAIRGAAGLGLLVTSIVGAVYEINQIKNETNPDVHCGAVIEEIVQPGDRLTNMTGNNVRRTRISTELNEALNPDFDAGDMQPGDTVLICTPPGLPQFTVVPGTKGK